MIDSTAHSVPRTAQYAVCNPASIRLRRLLLPLVLIGVDYGAMLAAVWTAWFLRASVAPWLLEWPFQPFHVSWGYMYVIIPFAFILFIHFARLYTRRLLFWQQAEQLFKVSLYAVMLLLVLMFITGAVYDLSRIFLVSVWITGFLYLTVSQYLVKKILFIAGLWQIPVVLVGAGKTAELLINAFETDSGLGYKVAGLIEDKPDPVLRAKYPVIGTFHQAETAIKRAGVKDVLIAAPGLSREELLDMVYRLQPYVDNITFVPDLFGVPVGAIELDTLFNERAVLLKIRNNLANGYNRLVKRIFDIVASTVIFLMVSPLLLLIAAFIKLDSKGPVFFIGSRIGRGKHEFGCVKFRTMFEENDKILAKYLEQNPEAAKEWVAYAKLKTHDPRVTKVGRFLRRYSLDELPQIFNVLAGQMSLVGPRPYLPREKAALGPAAATILETRPGITGLWQTSGRNELPFSQRIALDAWYVRNWSFWLDVTILLKTVKVVATGKGAY